MVSKFEQLQRQPFVGALLLASIFMLTVSCSSDTDDGLASTSTVPLVSSPAGVPVSPADAGPTSVVADQVQQFTNYALFYTSTCGDGPAITAGTAIEVAGDNVSIVAGEEPWLVGSLALWNELAVAAVADGRLVDIALDRDGFLAGLEIQGRGIDDEFCVEISDFEAR